MYWCAKIHLDATENTNGMTWFFLVEASEMHLRYEGMFPNTLLNQKILENYHYLSESWELVCWLWVFGSSRNKILFLTATGN